MFPSLTARTIPGSTRMIGSIASRPKSMIAAGTTLVRNFTNAAQDKPKEKGLHRFQPTLPRLPLPTLEETLPRFLETAKPLLTQEEYAEAEKLAKEFPEKGGRKLQELLLERARTAKGHWLEDWWNNLAYLEYRDPICLWVNYAFVLRDETRDLAGANPQTNRAARMVFAALKFKHLVETEELEPDMIKTTPLSSDQYPYLFNATRIPRDVRDECKSYPGSRHIVVARSNRFYSINVLDEHGNPYSPADIEAQLQKVIEIDSQNKEVAHPVGIFTAEHRDEWAKIYKELEADPTNKETIHQIQSSILMVCLDEDAPERLNQLSELLLHSDAKNRWFDKQIQLIVFKNGKAGFNYEHARIDGLTTVRLTNYVFEESQKIASGQRSAVNSAPLKLGWKLNASLLQHLEKASENVKALIANNETDSIEFKAFGANTLKNLKLSPDSVVQLAFQLAHYRMNGHLVATYESASTKEFYHGRTEVVRSATSAALDFCKALERNSNVPLKQKQDLLQKALAAHNNYMKFAKVAKGVDRHIFGLKMIATENGIPRPDFLQHVSISRTSHWALSTSNCGSPNLRLFAFGPVVPDGYGLGYMIHEDGISVNVASQRACPKTSSRLLANGIEHALLDIQLLASGVLSRI